MATAARRIALVAVVLGAACLAYGLATRDPARTSANAGSAAAASEERTPPGSPVEQAARDQAERVAIGVQRLAVFRAMEPSERMAAMVISCPSEPGSECNKDGLGEIIRAAADGAERASLSKKAEDLALARQRDPAAPQQPAQQPPQIQVPAGGVPDEQAAGQRGGPIQGRESFAGRFEAALVERKLNAERVSVTGPGKTTLDVQGFACSEGFLSNVQQSNFGTEAKALGFKRITCSHDTVNAGVDL
jgi:hypothetical protein